MRFFLHITAGLFFISLLSCNHSDSYRQAAKTADSLVGSVAAITGELAQSDTALLARSIQVYERYEGFIRGHVNDTIDRETAELLKHFYESGRNLQSYKLNRTDLLARSALNISQLEKLSADVKSKAVKVEMLMEYLATEKMAAGELIRASQEQLQLLNKNLAQLKNSLNGIEKLIRNHNNGELPVVVREQTTL